MDAPKPTTPQDSRLHFLDYWRIIRIRKTVILAVFLLVVLTTTVVTFMLPKSYMSMVRIAVEKDVADINPLGMAQNTSQFDPYFIQTEFEKIKSKSVLYPVIEQLNLRKRFGDRYNDGTDLTTTEAYEVLSAMVDLRQTRNTSLIEIRVYVEERNDNQDRADDEAAELANAIAGVYKTNRLELKMESKQRGINTLSNQLAEHTIQAAIIQTNLDLMKQKYGISDLTAEGSGVAMMIEPEIVRRMEADRGAAEVGYKTLMATLAKLHEIRARGGNELNSAIMNAYPDQDLGKLLQDLWFTETRIAKEGQSLGTNHPDFKALVAMKEKLDMQVDTKIKGILSGLEVQATAKKETLDSLTKLVADAKTTEAEKTEQYRPYMLLKRELENVHKIRDVLVLRKLQEEVDMSIPKSGIVEIIDRAEAAAAPVRPNVPLNITLGIIVGLVVGVGLAFFIEYLDTSVKTIDDVERALQAPVLGVIPQNVGSLLEEGPECPHAEAYRVLRTNILFSRKREDANTLSIISGGAGEGKSTTIFNLCNVFSQNGQRVLLVDSDLRRPSLHKLFGVSNAAGLTNYLLGQNKLEEVIQTTKIPTLDFLPSGKLPSSSLGIINSPQMRDFIKEIRQRYDFVFFDSPPIMGVSDASVLASMVDMTLLVIQYRKYPQALTVRAKQMVEKIGGNLLGVVLNNINISQDSYYYYYSGYYYDYYSKREGSDEASGKNGHRKRSSRSSRGQVDLKPKY